MFSLPNQMKITPDCSASLEPFWQSLAETIAWSVPRINSASPRDCLRSATVRGRTLQNSYSESVSGVIDARKCNIPGGSLTPDPSKGFAGGRLIVYFPDFDMCDGLAESESRGFFDVYNTPPWDTWVAFVSEQSETEKYPSNYLIAWVPPEFIKLADAGINVNAERCIEWLARSNTSFAKLVSP